MLQEWRDYCTKVVKIERRASLNLARNCFQDMVAIIAQEKNVIKVHRERSLKFKVIFLLKKRACDKKRRRAISALVTKRYNSKMMTNVYQALQERNVRNKEWRKDLIKRYWINNSESEGEDEETQASGQSVTTGSPFENPHSFKDEFFPVKVCTQKKVTNIQEMSKTFMHDVEEDYTSLC